VEALEIARAVSPSWTRRLPVAGSRQRYRPWRRRAEVERGAGDRRRARFKFNGASGLDRLPAAGGGLAKMAWSNR
jgi:hypothetical protein